MRKSRVNISYFFAFLFLFPSCLSITTLQSGRTVGKENAAFALSGTTGKYTPISIIELEEDPFFPVVEIGVKYGVNESLDLGLKFSSLSFCSMGLQKQFLGNKHSFFASSVGLESGLNFGPLLLGVLDFYATLPILNSIHPNEKFSFYFAPRYIYKSEVVVALPYGSSFDNRKKNHYFGNSYGMLYGRKNKIAIDVSNFNNGIFRPSQFSVGYIFNLQKPFVSKNKKIYPDTN